MKLDQFRDRDSVIRYLKTEKGCETEKDAERYLYQHLPMESSYQTKIMEFLRKNYPNAFVWKAAAGPYSRGGIPDICVVMNGRFYGFEVKRPFIGQLTKLQKQTIEAIRAAGGIAAVVSYPDEVNKILKRR